VKLEQKQKEKVRKKIEEYRGIKQKEMKIKKR